MCAFELVLRAGFTIIPRKKQEARAGEIIEIEKNGAGQKDVIMYQQLDHMHVGSEVQINSVVLNTSTNKT